MYRKLSSGLDIAIQKAVEQARDTNFFEASTTGRGVYPFINLFEKEGDLVLAAELPGVKKEDVNIKLENNLLEVEGRIDYAPYEKLNPVYAEYNIGNYARSFTVSNAVDTSNIEAVLRDGVLSLTLLKAPEAKPRVISVK